MEQRITKAYKEASQALKGIYQQRKRTLFFQKLVWIITGIIILLMLLNMVANSFSAIKIDFLPPFEVNNSNPYAKVLPLIVLVVLLYPATYFFTNAFQKFKIKESITITKMVKTLFPAIEFEQSMIDPINEVKKSKLFAWVKNETHIYSYGQIRHTINRNPVNISDIGMVEKKVSNQLLDSLIHTPLLSMLVVLYQYVFKNISTNKSADSVQYTFRGMFCWLQFKKSLQGHTVILTNNQSTKIDRYFRSNFNQEQRIDLEDPRFTDQFIVYSTDQVEARYVLSTAIMERIVTLKEQFNQPILLSFLDQQMYLAVKNNNGIFSFPSGKLDSIKIIEELAHDINTALQVASALKLEKV